jgi:class 3 adenylate cyclase/pimeloyl-ACP methyl ester carboxylesterase
MAPRIQYAKTSDGVSIAYGEAGEGRPLIAIVNPAFSHVELSWEAWANILPPLASRFRTAWYDARGTGLSDRRAVDFSMEAMIRDLEAVVARTGFDSFVLVGWTQSVSIAVTYAVARPERVSHLILCDPVTTHTDISQTSAYRATVALLEMDWVLFTETFGQVLWALPDPESGRHFGEFLRACSEPEAHRAFWSTFPSYDVTALLPRVTAPTLVIQNKNNRFVVPAVGQRLAAVIPGARLAAIDDNSYAPIAGLIEAFVSEGEAREPHLPSGMTAILFADIVDSTALTERLGDAAFRAKARQLDEALRGVIRNNDGTPIEGKLLGDGVLAVFTSARQAIEAALACGRSGDEAGLPLHLGLHAGDVIRESDPDGRANVYGGAVNIASRIAGLSAAGEVLVSETVRSLARTSAGVRFDDRGEQELKGVGEKVRVWAVRESIV